MGFIRRTFFSLLLLLAVANTLSASVTWTLVTSQDQIVSGKIYMVAAYKSTTKKYYCFFNPALQGIGYYIQSGKVDKSSFPSSVVTDNLKSYLCFKLTKEASGWTLYNMYSHKYQSVDKGSSGYVFKNDDAVTDADYWNIELNQDGQVEITRTGSTYHISYDYNNSDMQFYTSSRANTVAPSLYELTSYTLDESTDYTESDAIYSLPVTLNRSFTANTYNTLVLPCGVNNYKTVFGANTQAYELNNYTSSTGKEINFTSVSGDNLIANKPYIIAGSAFNASPYSLGTVELGSSSASVTSTTSAGNCNYIGVYATTDLAGQDDYVLYNKKFYSCKSKTSPFNIAPFRCYFTLSDGVNAKFMVDGDEPTNIDNAITEKTMLKKDGTIYNLCGMKMTDVAASQHGVYIKNGKKYIK